MKIVKTSYGYDVVSTGPVRVEFHQTGEIDPDIVVHEIDDRCTADDLWWALKVGVTVVGALFLCWVLFDVICYAYKL